MAKHRKSERLAFYQWFPGDYLSDPRINAMSLTVEACYRRLLDYAWKLGESGTDCSLPDDDRFLASCCRMSEVQFKSEVRPVLIDGPMPVFASVDGKLINKRLRQEFDTACGKIRAAQASADARWGNDAGRDANALRTHCERNPTASLRASGIGISSISHESSSSEKGCGEKPKPPRAEKQPADFEAWWASYPRRVAKSAARRAWARLDPTHTEAAVLMAAVAAARASPQWAKDDGQFIPHPATWLNGARWEDSIGGTCEQPIVAKVDKYAADRQRAAEQAKRRAAATGTDPEVATD